MESCVKQEYYCGKNHQEIFGGLENLYNTYIHT